MMQGDEPMTIESAIEQMCDARIAVFNVELDRVRAEMRASGIAEADIDRAVKEAITFFGQALAVEARHLGRSLADVLPRRSNTLH